jgi:anti-anti-sigma regulatory factor
MGIRETCPPPAIVTLPAQISAANAEQAGEEIGAAFTPGVTVVIADLTPTAGCDRSAIRHLLKAHRQAAVRGRQVRFVIRPGGPVQRITDFADIHPLLAVYPTLQHAITGQSPKPPRQPCAVPAAAITSTPSVAARRAALRRRLRAGLSGREVRRLRTAPSGVTGVRD